MSSVVSTLALTAVMSRCYPLLDTRDVIKGYYRSLFFMSIFQNIPQKRACGLPEEKLYGLKTSKLEPHSYQKENLNVCVFYKSVLCKYQSDCIFQTIDFDFKETFTAFTVFILQKFGCRILHTTIIKPNINKIKYKFNPILP